MTQVINIGLSGLAGWNVLKRTEDRHLERLEKDPVIQRNTNHFKDKIEIVGSAKELVEDYRMLRVVLGAFGLQDDLPNKGFIRKILESDIEDRTSLANRLTDKRYLKLAVAFKARNVETEKVATGETTGADSEPTSFAERVSQAYLKREFEIRVGETDDSFRLALNARRELQSFAERDTKDRTLWFEVIGSPPMRKVFEGAFGFGPEHAKIPVDRQVEEFKKASERLLKSSSFSEITKPENIEKLVQTFLVRSQVGSITTQGRYSTALALLTG